jgi:hypothetical protein
MKEIKVLVSPSGEVTISTQGFIGGSCKDITKNLENLLGEIGEEEFTSEFYLTEENNNSINMEET